MGSITKSCSMNSAANAMPMIAGVEITTDEAGRFNLNALHRASGTGDHKAPNQWLRYKQAKELISELESQLDQAANSQFAQKAINSVHGGVCPGTFAHELLAISYAGWISPAFQLQVNQVFLDYRTGKLTQPAQKEISRKDLALMVIQAEEENERLQAENQILEQKIEEVKPVVEAFERIAVADGSMNITEAAKALQIQPKKLFNLLSQEQWIYKRAGGQSWLGYQAKIQQGLVEHKVTTVERTDGSAKTVEQVRITPKGLTKLARQLSVGGVQ